MSNLSFVPINQVQGPFQPSSTTISPEKSTTSDSLIARYEAAFGHDEATIHFLDKLLPRLPHPATVLDIACGTGRPIATTLAAAGHNIMGIDIMPDMIALSKSRVPSGTFEVADMRSWEMPAGMEPDVILSILGLFAFDRDTIEALIEKWAGWMQPNTLLCLCSIAAEDVDVDVDGRSQGYDDDGMCVRDIRWKFMGDDVTITLFSRRGWTWLLEKNGLEIVDTLTELFVPPVESGCDEEIQYFIMARKVG